MIIITLSGGLGNQMFQYAAAKSLAEFRGVELGLDLGWFENIPKGATARKFELGWFEVECKVQRVKYKAPWIPVFTRMTKLFFAKKFYTEPHYQFDPKFFKLGNDVHLSGYFQSEKYFKNIEAVIRKEFSFKNEQEGKNKELAELIQKNNSVSLHIRRGDYVSDVKTNQTHGICDLDYYQRCIQEIEKEVENPYFFVFSDDIDWVKENLKIDSLAKYIGYNTGEKSYEDMRLMSQCKHNIIANSSFSWWGAWLNANPNKIVFVPKRWFVDDSKNIKDVIPEGWRKV